MRVSLKVLSVVWSLKVQNWSNSDNTERIDGPVTDQVVLGNVLHVHRVTDVVQLVDVPGVRPDVWIVYDSLPVTLEVPHVDHIKPDEGGEQPNISLRQTIASQIPRLTEDSLDSLEGIKELMNGNVVRFL